MNKTLIFQISFYIPEAQCEQVKKAMFDAGAGTLGNYQQCSWQVLGQGQFKPMQGSQPFIGETDLLEQVNEYKVEMICAADKIKNVIQALIKSHPYEEPAYTITEQSNINLQ